MEEEIYVKKLPKLSNDGIFELKTKLHNKELLTSEQVCQLLEAKKIGKANYTISAMKNIIENRPDKIQVVSDIFNKFCNIEYENGKFYIFVRAGEMPFRIRIGLIKMSNEINRNKRNKNKLENKQILDDLQK